ncbi:hypothetical protein H9X85_00780 [Anaerotignum lactatifermentans]|uniref:DUF5640 domain-containing protein n=1 Tax=Anaerotignum lactatifermentans TaxID=160404 RepID=A0ABS2G5G4_9FIRM|nr:hypothetical protein [Anaerotignum lactatifermentans]MBM6828161.1 hypothetical protein [Anaerotignum lactatifermentans]MBM6876676.1 hypothetical protein [Anaerotignum lactatifermentans]MBM6949744.1 hypothetical protein [Anaerotignum lactatifermentans]
MKKRYFLIPILLLAIICCWTVLHAPDGKTRESREKLLEDLPKGIQWTIEEETNIEDYIISGAYSTDGSAALVVFAPTSSGGWQQQTRVIREDEDVLLQQAVINGKYYDIAWISGISTTKGEMRYDAGGTEEVLEFDTTQGNIIFHQTDFKSYTLSVRYLDKNGTIYE